jgi:hypothetical protein
MLHPPRVCCWLSALLILVGAGLWGTLCANVTNLTCTQRSGQLFFSWDSSAGALGYNLYVSTALIQNSQDLAAAQLNATRYYALTALTADGEDSTISPASPPALPGSGELRMKHTFRSMENIWDAFCRGMERGLAIGAGSILSNDSSRTTLVHPISGESSSINYCRVFYRTTPVPRWSSPHLFSQETRDAISTKRPFVFSSTLSEQ